MIKKPFFSFGKPGLKYSGVDALHQKETPADIPDPGRILLQRAFPGTDSVVPDIRPGDRVRTGQRVRLSGSGETFLVSSATGTVSSVSEEAGFYGQTVITIAIETDDADQWDKDFSAALKGPDGAPGFLESLPGCPGFGDIIRSDPPLDTLIINALDQDLLIVTQQFALQAAADRLAAGIERLKRQTGAGRVILAVSPNQETAARKSGAQVAPIDPVYPNALPELLVKRLLGKVVPAGGGLGETGVGCITAEAVAALEQAFSQGRPPVHKLVTVIDKAEKAVCVRVRIGTPIREILDFLDIKTGEGDRLVVGGPMRGRAVHTAETPVLHDTDAVFVQDRENVVPGSDTPCVNCGECVRACPAGIPVNMLVRLLENGQYQEAATQYDLLSCVECGLCAYVCIARIPIFHYIMLGKHEIALAQRMEESNA